MMRMSSYEARVNSPIDSAKLQAIIAAIEVRPELWDFRCQSYKDQHETARSWRQVATSMRMPMPEVKRQWKNLRDGFARSWKAAGYCEARGEFMKPPKWRWFHNMSFLLPLYIASLKQRAHTESFMDHIGDMGGGSNSGGCMSDIPDALRMLESPPKFMEDGDELSCDNNSVHCYNTNTSDCSVGDIGRYSSGLKDSDALLSSTPNEELILPKVEPTTSASVDGGYADGLQSPAVVAEGSVTAEPTPIDGDNSTNSLLIITSSQPLLQPLDLKRPISTPPPPPLSQHQADDGLNGSRIIKRFKNNTNSNNNPNYNRSDDHQQSGLQTQSGAGGACDMTSAHLNGLGGGHYCRSKRCVHHRSDDRFSCSTSDQYTSKQSHYGQNQSVGGIVGAFDMSSSATSRLSGLPIGGGGGGGQEDSIYGGEAEKRGSVSRVGGNSPREEQPQRDEERFGASVAATLHGLSRRRKSVAKLKIQQILFDLEQADIAEDESHSIESNHVA